MIIAVDYDGTLEIDGNINLQLVNWLKRQQRGGGIVILWTCRNGERLLQAVGKLKEAGLTPNLVNENAPQTVKQLGYNPRKILADVYIDDKNAR